MSLIVLDSKGQDPAEFENHFGGGLKLPSNAEICLVGSNINFKQNGADNHTIQEGNDTFTIQYGNVDTQGTNESGAYTVKLKHGHFTSVELASIMYYAFIDGGFQNGQKSSTYWSNQPISSLRAALNCTYDPATKKMQISCERQTVGTNDINPYNDDAEVGESFFASTGKFGSRVAGYNNQLTKGANLVPRLTRWGVDSSFAEWFPPNEEEFNDGGREDCLAILSKYPIWTHSTGAAPLLPTNGTFGGAPRINPFYTLGQTWLFDPVGFYVDNRDKLPCYMGGIVSNKRVGVTGWGSQQKVGVNNIVNRQSFDNWSNGGVKYSIWWEIEPDDISSVWRVKFYYHPTNISPWAYENRIQFGQQTFEENKTNVIHLIPKNGTCGIDPTAPSLPGGDATRFIWEGRVSRTPTVTAATLNTTFPAILAGFQGYVAVTDGGNFDLYKELPLFQGANLKTDGRPMLAGTDVTIKMQSLRHMNVGTSSMGALYNGNPLPVQGTGTGLSAPSPYIVDGNQTPFRSIYFGWSPVREILPILTPYINHSFRNMTDRYSNIARTLGFNENSLSFIAPNSLLTLDSDFTDDLWTESTGVVVIQMPNLPVEGALGCGSTVWGGSNSAQIIGVAPISLLYIGLRSDSSYSEPANENWIKLKNLCMNSLNQLKIKLTDTTGRKLRNLAPNSTIWIKIRQGCEDRTLKAGDGENYQKISAQSFYNRNT
tara:strand:- start:3075 stop:5210 length:2136 start_codon:yes stop_codon:yes gene_type:complete